MDTLVLPQAPAKLPTIKRVTPSNTPNGRFIPSRPHPPTSAIKHSTVTANTRSTSTTWLSTHKDSAVSIHTLANRDGSLTEIVPPGWTAFHAGWALPGYSNAESLGLEFENSSDNAGRSEPYPEAQIIAGAYRIACWQFSYGIPDERVKHHREIAVFPTDHPRAGQLGRKFDCCGPFPDALFDMWRLRWLEFFRSLPSELHELYIV